MIQFIASEIRKAAISNADLYAKIGTRFYPQRIDLVSNPEYPIIAFNILEY